MLRKKIKMFRRFENSLRRSVRRFILVASVISPWLFILPISAQQSKITQLHIEKKDGHADGKAVATVRGPVKKKGKVTEADKSGSIGSHVLQAWTVMDGEGALLLLSPEKQGDPYRLRYHQVDVGKGRLLGFVPFNKAVMVETKHSDGWAFALSGIDEAAHQPVVVAGDVNAIHARLDGASEPRFDGDSLSIRAAEGPKAVPLATLMGWSARGKIYSTATQSADARHLQFLPTGDSITTNGNGHIEHGRWVTDGTAFHVVPSNGPQAIWPVSDLRPVQGVPAGSVLTVRLTQSLSSRTARAGMEVKALLISPGVYDGAILLPQGAEFDGKIVDAHAVGWGIRRETAALTLHFNTVKLPNGSALPIDAKVLRIENSREQVTADGKIQGVRATGTIGHQAENQLNSLAQIDPIAYIFTSSAGPAALGFSESEILYNAGTELDVEFNKPLITSQVSSPKIPPMNLSSGEATELRTMIKDLPFRTQTEVGHQPSDITNLVFLGTPDSLRRMLDAAGWTFADSLTAAATFQTIKTIAGNQTYTQAPMSTLVLDNRKPIFTMQKTTNTFASRHHLRVFDTGRTFNGQPVLTSSSTQDIGIAFSSKQKTFIHVIDQYLDNERSKVVNDLEFTGCLKSLDTVPRSWVPMDAYNATGDRLRTDGAVAVLGLEECAHPYATPASPAQRPGWFERSERNTVLTIKDTLYRGNLIYTGISGGIKLHRYFATQGELSTDAGNWRKSDVAGTSYRISGPSSDRSEPRLDLSRTLSPESQREIEAASRALDAAHKWDPPPYEIALNIGYSNYRHNIPESVAIEIGQPGADLPKYVLGLADGVFDGWAAGVSLTLNTWNWISNDFSYMRQQTKFDLVKIQVPIGDDSDISLDTQTVGLVTRRFAYNTVFNLRPRRSRWRPYIAAGPAFQLLALSDAPLKKPPRVFKLGASNIGLLKAAFDFGSTPPLDGGGVFQFGLQYGAGIKYRVTPRFMVRGDYGETWSPTPKIIRDSYENFKPDDLDDSYKTSVIGDGSGESFIQRRFTVGFAFTF